MQPFYTFFNRFFFNFIFKLYKIVLVLPNIKMNPPQVYILHFLIQLVSHLCNNLESLEPMCLQRRESTELVSMTISPKFISVF